MTTNQTTDNTNPFADFDRHGQIRCGTISVRNLSESVALYCDYLSYQLVDDSPLGLELADCWVTPALVDAPSALLQPASGAKSFLRLIELPDYPDFEPAKTVGWTAFEICVADVFQLAEKLESSAFQIVGPPKLVDGFTSFIPMQVVGPNNEILFLNQVNHSDPDVELPIAQSAVDQLFIAVVASPDRERTAADYVDGFDLDPAATHNIRYSLLNRAFGLDAETKHQITMVQKGRMPLLQVDPYPAGTEHLRPCRNGSLPPGNAVLSIMVEDLDALSLDAASHSKICRLDGPIYEGRRVVTVCGVATELIELIELD